MWGVQNHRVPLWHPVAFFANEVLDIFKTVISIMWNKPKEFENLIPRLGGMQFLMSFIGCVGALMATTGIVQLLEHAFA